VTLLFEQPDRPQEVTVNMIAVARTVDRTTFIKQ
jgi:hypothetical protein